MLQMYAGSAHTEKAGAEGGEAGGSGVEEAGGVFAAVLEEAAAQTVHLPLQLLHVLLLSRLVLPGRGGGSGRGDLALPVAALGSSSAWGERGARHGGELGAREAAASGDHREMLERKERSGAERRIQFGRWERWDFG
uniref:Uncharacterized protein n=1 Tax=Oryza meridionalis TaxID=40149 RepID=A0A0E0DGZ2_9ORYZ